MGKARRRRAGAYDTLDGGEPSDDRIVLQVDVFDVRESDEVRLIALRKRMRRRPLPICGACEYEFAYGELPPVLFSARPMFPKGEGFTVISGVICPRCACRQPDELIAAIVGYLREVKPDVTLVEGGTA